MQVHDADDNSAIGSLSDTCDYTHEAVNHMVVSFTKASSECSYVHTRQSIPCSQVN